MPIPATYNIKSEGIIVWRQFDPDYKKQFTAGNAEEISELTGLKLKEVYSDNRIWFSLLHLVK